MGYRSLASALLEELSAVLDELSEMREPPADSSIVLLSGFLLNVAASFASSPPAPLMALAFGAILSLTSRKLGAWLKTVSLVAAFTGAVAAPAALQGRVAETLLLLARASGATSALVGATASLGWYWLLHGLSRLRLLNLLTWQLWLTLRMIPILSRETVRMLVAREARVFASSRRIGLEIVGSALGDLLAGGYRRARALSMAVEARTIASGPAAPNQRLRWSLPGAVLLGYAVLATSLLLAGA